MSMLPEKNNSPGDAHNFIKNSLTPFEKLVPVLLAAALSFILVRK